MSSPNTEFAAKVLAVFDKPRGPSDQISAVIQLCTAELGRQPEPEPEPEPAPAPEPEPEPVDNAEGEGAVKPRWR